MRKKYREGEKRLIVILSIIAVVQYLFLQQHKVQTKCSVKKRKPK